MPQAMRVLTALRLQAGQEAELEDWSSAGRRMTLAEFTRWVKEVLEAARFVPAHRRGRAWWCSAHAPVAGPPICRAGAARLR
jgi:hypothetical protein